MSKQGIALIEEIKEEIETAYHCRQDYPPYALNAWDDRNRYHDYIFKILDEFIEAEGDKGGDVEE